MFTDPPRALVMGKENLLRCSLFPDPLPRPSSSCSVEGGSGDETIVTMVVAIYTMLLYIISVLLEIGRSRQTGGLFSTCVLSCLMESLKRSTVEPCLTDTPQQRTPTI